MSFSQLRERGSTLALLRNMLLRPAADALCVDAVRCAVLPLSSVLKVSLSFSEFLLEAAGARDVEKLCLFSVMLSERCDDASIGTVSMLSKTMRCIVGMVLFKNCERVIFVSIFARCKSVLSSMIE